MSTEAAETDTSTEENEVIEDSGNESWLDKVSDDHKEIFKGFKSQDEVLKAAGYTPPKGDGKDWREGLSEDEKKTAERFTSPADAVRSIMELRKRESSVRVPGKDATDEEISKYHKAIGVPETAEGYKFKLAEGEELTPEIEATNKEWGKIFHELNVPVGTVDKLIGHLREKAVQQHEATVKADKEFLEQSEAALKAEWTGDDFEKNKGAANRAFKEVANRAGVNLEDLTTMETKEGRFIMDDPRLMKLFAVIGREMGEGSLGSNMSEDEKDSLDEQITQLREKQEEAKSKGNSKLANKLFKQEQELIGKRDGNKKIA